MIKIKLGKISAIIKRKLIKLIVYPVVTYYYGTIFYFSWFFWENLTRLKILNIFFSFVQLMICNSKSAWSYGVMDIFGVMDILAWQKEKQNSQRRTQNTQEYLSCKCLALLIYYDDKWGCISKNTYWKKLKHGHKKQRMLI